ncbi:sodium:alanine symporter family protein [Lysinibacillus agricola]|uniref:Sodium:alanine symporter family protein n=2 Tax=Lysinibacillus agricola TaxID=2590012 RepID=A0ABX7AXU2_9BACI|nr:MULTISPECIES: sodium:alanine symporter family protein [Lysinibacillus]KOS60569.1 amino acid carrier protein [Lysinibacillus sp. FJAT-14222]QQP14805.1 sodium:alanine symporter family protein [Lysinibacillus agricola]
MMSILVFGGIFFTIRLGFFQFIKLPHILSETFGKLFRKNNEGEGTVTPFQATTSALASTLGAANLVGVPVAIAFGGPGAIFWMWVVAIFGIATKYSEVVLGMKYREKNDQGEYVGGPMYYMKNGLKWNKVAIFFAFALMLEIGASIMVQTNSIAKSISGSFSIPAIAVGIAMIIIVYLGVYGGIKSISRMTEKLVPFMVTFYIIGITIILVYYYKEIPAMISLIFTSALQPISAVGGFAGAGVAQAIRWGLARGLYSNEAGMGTAPIAHSTAQNVHPAKQGFWGAFEVIVDTMIVSTMTALAVLVSGAWKEISAENAALMVTKAFTPVFGKEFAGIFVSITLFVLVITTVLVIAFYGEKQAEFLFGSKFSLFMRFVYLGAIIVGSIGGLQFIWKFLDLLLALVVIPNMIAILCLSKEVKMITNDYFKRYLVEQKRGTIHESTTETITNRNAN